MYESYFCSARVIFFYTFLYTGNNKFILLTRMRQKSMLLLKIWFWLKDCLSSFWKVNKSWS